MIPNVRRNQSRDTIVIPLLREIPRKSRPATVPLGFGARRTVSASLVGADVPDLSDARLYMPGMLGEQPKPARGVPGRCGRRGQEALRHGCRVPLLARPSKPTVGITMDVVILIAALLLLQPANQTPAQPDPPVEIEEHVVVTATRSDRRIQDEPLRVEVIDREEIEEKALMTPGSVAMLLGETTGLRVQITAPSIGAANVRIQGLRGRYAQLLADGLPLYGGGDSLQPAASATARSRAGRSDQGRRLRALRSRGARRRDQPRIAPAARDRNRKRC